MIGALAGTVFSFRKTQIVLMVNGVGYAVSIPGTLLSTLTIGQSCTLCIHTHVRDDALDLFGFLLDDELQLFELLLTVSGIGPKTALIIVDRGVPKTEHAVANADVEFFTSIPRVGKKNAQKIIIELKSRIGSIHDLDLSSENENNTSDIRQALSGMGFARQEINKALEQLKPEDTTPERKIRRALQYLGT